MNDSKRKDFKKGNNPSLKDSPPTLKMVKLANFTQRIKAQIIDIFMIYMPILYFLAYVVVGNAQALGNLPGLLL